MEAEPPELKNRAGWRLGESLERPIEKNEENKEFFDTLDDYLSPVGADYVIQALKSLGPEYTTQIPYGREMLDKAIHWINFLRENFHPTLNNLKSVSEAGYSFAILPEIEIFFDDHDLVNAPVLVFDFVFVGPVNRVPVFKKWKDTLKCSMLGSVFTPMEFELYSLDDDWKETRLHLSKLLYNNDIDNPKEPEEMTLISDEKVTQIATHYNLPPIISHSSDLKFVNPFHNSEMDDKSILTSRFCESFLWSEDFGSSGHPILRPNTVKNVPKSCLVDHRIGDPELLLWKEKKAQGYFKDVMTECNLKYKDSHSESKIFGEADMNISKLEKMTKTSDLNDLFSTITSDNSKKRAAVVGFDEKMINIDTITKPKQASLDSFFTKKENVAKPDSIEENTCSTKEKDEARFLKSNRLYFKKEFEKEPNVHWLPTISRLSHLCSPLSSKLMLNYDWLIKTFGSDLVRVLDPTSEQDDPKDINISTLETSNVIHVYRCHMNTNISHYHYRSFRKHVPKPPSDIINDDIVMRELTKAGLTMPYTETTLFHKKDLMEKFVNFKNDIDKLVGSSDPDNITKLENLVSESRDLRLFDNLNQDKYKRLKWDLYSPEFIKDTLTVTRVELEDKFSSFKSSQNAKTADMVNKLFKEDGKTKRGLNQ